MGLLVEELLTLARLDERRPLLLADLDLSAIAADAVNDFRAVAPDRRIELIAPKPVPLLGDETAIRQVFANLLTNARVHTPPATPVEVRVAASGRDARIDVLDDGGGIEAADRGHAFGTLLARPERQAPACRRERARPRDRRGGRYRARWHRVRCEPGRADAGRTLRGDPARSARRLSLKVHKLRSSRREVGPRQIPSSISMKLRIGVLALMGVLPLVLTACGGGGNKAEASSSTTPSSDGAGDTSAFTKCLSDHGVTLPSGADFGRPGGGEGGPPNGEVPNPGEAAAHPAARSRVATTPSSKRPSRRAVRSCRTAARDSAATAPRTRRRSRRTRRA